MKTAVIRYHVFYTFKKGFWISMSGGSGMWCLENGVSGSREMNRVWGGASEAFPRQLLQRVQQRGEVGPLVRAVRPAQHQDVLEHRNKISVTATEWNIIHLFCGADVAYVGYRLLKSSLCPFPIFFYTVRVL